MGRAGTKSMSHQHHLAVPVPKVTLSHVKQTTKEDLHGYADHFFGDSQVHGFKEAYTAKSTSTRLFWITVCVLCGGMALFEIQQVVKSYMQGSVATQISIERDHDLQYPTLLLCPTAWISKRKMQELGIEQQGLKFLGKYITDSHYHKYTKTTKRKLLRITKYINDLGKQQINAALTIHPRMDWLLQNLTSQPRVEQDCGCCEDDTSELRILERGACISVPFCNGTYEEPDAHMYLDENGSESLNGDKPGVLVGMFNSVYDIEYRSNPVLFAPPGTKSTIVVTMKKYVKRPTNRNPCSPQQAQDHCPECPIPVQQCTAICDDMTDYKGCRRCTMKQFLNATNTDQLCQINMLQGRPGRDCETREVRRAIAEAARDCKDKCEPPCEERIYSIYSTVTTESKTKQNAVEIRMRFHTFSYTLLTDVSTLELETFVSAIGGQLGLWCGASVISIFQLVSFVCCPCLYCREKAASIQRQLSKNLSRRSHKRRSQPGLEVPV